MYSDLSEMEEGDFYIDKIGYKVFTEQYLLKRGYCCQSGCKHCPYGYDSKTGLITKPIKNNKNE